MLWNGSISLFFLVSLVSLTSCHRKKKELDLKDVNGRAVVSDKAIQIPRNLAKIIERDFLKVLKSKQIDDSLSDAQLLGQAVRKYINISVVITPELNTLALKDRVTVNLPSGGGLIDLSDFIVGNKGSFRIRFALGDKDSVSGLRVFFLPHSKKRKIKSEVFGSGCGEFADITDFFKSHFLTEGLKLNATDQRYLSVIAGTFYLYWFQDGELHLGSVTFEDTRYLSLQCMVTSHRKVEE